MLVKDARIICNYRKPVQFLRTYEPKIHAHNDDLVVFAVDLSKATIQSGRCFEYYFISADDRLM